MITGKYDRWSTSTIARKFQVYHQGDHSIAEFNIGHRMGASIGLGNVDKVTVHTVDWLKAGSKN
jgi:hypothetical protein